MRKHQIRKSCIGTKTLANPSGKCSGDRLHSLKYNSRKKYYCTDCFAIMCKRLASRITSVQLMVR